MSKEAHTFFDCKGEIELGVKRLATKAFDEAMRDEALAARGLTKDENELT